MGRRSTQDLMKDILDSLDRGPRSVNEIVKDTDLDRTVISRYISVFVETGLVIEVSDECVNKYSLTSPAVSGAYFNLPLTDSQHKLFDSLYAKIQEVWKTKATRQLHKTTAQKILYRVVQRCSLEDIPTGWYLYGGIAVKPFDYTKKYSPSGLPKEVEDCVHEAVDAYSKNNYAYEDKKQQYDEEKNKLYSTKEKILSLLYSKHFSERSLYVLEKFYATLVRLAPSGEGRYGDLLDQYVEIIVDSKEYYDRIDDKELFVRLFIRSFEALWKLIALHQFKGDLEDGGHYSKKLLDEHFKQDILSAEEELMQTGSEVVEMIPYEEIDDPLYQEFETLIRGGATKSTSEEILKQNKELDKIEKEQGLEVMQKEVWKRVGLE